MIYLQLFIVYLQIGMFSFGGGYAAMPLIQTLIVEGRNWLTMEEFADLTTIAEMTPGPIAVNSATFVGQKMAGLPGAIVCTIGCIIPSIIIVLFLAYLYTRFKDLKIVKTVLGELRPAVVAMIGSAGLTILLLGIFGTSTISQLSFDSMRVVELILYVVALFVLRKFKVNPILIIFSTAIIGTIIYSVL